MINITEISNANIFNANKDTSNYGSRHQERPFESIYPRILETTSAILIPFMLEVEALNEDLMLLIAFIQKLLQPLITNSCIYNFKPLLTESN